MTAIQKAHTVKDFSDGINLIVFLGILWFARCDGCFSGSILKRK